MGDLRATFLDGPWDNDGTDRWVETPPPETITTPAGSDYRLVDVSDNLAVYQAVTAEFG
jgi:hypothetical protein